MIFNQQLWGELVKSGLLKLSSEKTGCPKFKSPPLTYIVSKILSSYGRCRWGEDRVVGSKPKINGALYQGTK